MELALLAPLVIVFVAIGIAAGAATWLLTDPQLLLVAGMLQIIGSVIIARLVRIEY